MKSSKDGIIIKENPLFDEPTSTSDLSEKESQIEVMFIMMADVTFEVAMVEMERKINLLMKVVEERDQQIAALRKQMQTCETTESSQTFIAKVDDKGKNVVQENQPQQQSAYVASSQFSNYRK
ncbi:ty3-gypsy retrotransposon protein [Cucumis melo var. makuwa]|uniref:Ty3-gypsy retrotransposon protein n=1 Tax=Cucumis melo var. makuwa TaxID=1194695 RepID=A0A5D3BBL6_CUCMM|nr:ty3-gypsy retrotransposon protein [Cucumis melo var. makuwa]TYJ96517.1 ty3-gypsy retrotransposon protein [Cucumis melo var. makuwa]